MDLPLSDAPCHRPRFDRAVVLFNQRAYFEAHEDWEELWHEAQGRERLWLQGLIQLAAAFVHYERGFFARGFAQLLRDASTELAGYEGPTWDLDVDLMQEALAPWRAHARRVAAGEALLLEAPAAPPTLTYRGSYAPRPLAPGQVDED